MTKKKAAKPRKGSLAAFEEHFRAAMASAIRNGVQHPFAVALLQANAATKADAARSAPRAPGPRRTR